MAQLHQMFPTNIVVEQLKNHEQYKDLIVPKLLEDFRSNPNQKAPWATDCHTWQQVADMTGLDELGNGLQYAIESYFNYLGCPPFKYEVRAWYNIHTSEMYQEVHDHAKGDEVLSGVYYLQFDKTLDQPTIFVNSNRHFADLLKYKGIDPTNYNQVIDVQEGSLILFHPDTQHYVPRSTQKHDGLRITLSFNVNFIHILEKNDSGN